MNTFSRKSIVVSSFLLTLLSIGFFVTASCSPLIEGAVVDEEGSPRHGVNVFVWKDESYLTRIETDLEGRFSLDAEKDGRYVIIIYTDDEATSGLDYFPTRIETEPVEDATHRIILEPAASLFLEGDIQYFESEKLPLATVFTVRGPDGETPLRYLDFSSEDPKTELIERTLGTQLPDLVVPADSGFTLGVNSSILVDSKLVDRYFEARDAQSFELSKGEQATVDVRRYSVAYNLGVLASSIDQVEARLVEMEGQGFYLVAERSTVSSAKRSLSEAQYLYQGGSLVESFDAGKKGYVDVRQTREKLGDMTANAYVSTFALMGFLALMSTSFAFILLNDDAMKLALSFGTFVLTVYVLYMVYPGCVLVPLDSFILAGFIAIASCLVAALAAPKVLKGRRVTGYVPVWMIIIPIFSLAKRGIKRRRLRFLLTLTSITLLVLSFVAFTSFSEGYGLQTSSVPGAVEGVEGVVIRAAGYSDESPELLSSDDAFSGWIERQGESHLVSPKAESIPFTLPVAYLNGTAVNGVLGVDPLREPSIIDIEGTLQAGRLPNLNEVSVSRGLSEKLGVGLGSRLTLNGEAMELVGIHDDEALSSLRDIDGSLYLPGKMVNLNPSGDAPSWVRFPCEPLEVVVTHIEDALSMPLVGVTRVDVVVGEGIDVPDFAERLALERGYWVWSVSGGAVQFVRLGGFLEGKGLPLVIPWIIVVLNVIVTMLNSMYERKEDIRILSSVGVNPAQISAVFVSEAMIIGLIGGGIGYLAGLSLYRAMALLGVTLGVHQKISALWSLASMGISMTAVLMGALVSLRGSIVITPSLKRRWRIEDEHGQLKPWDLYLPVKLNADELGPFLDYMVASLRRMERGTVNRVSSIKELEATEGYPARIDFTYKAASNVDNFITKNSLFVEREQEGSTFRIRLRTYGMRKWAQTTGSMVRMNAMKWSVHSKGKKTNEEPSTEKKGE